jgi:hypothetical protein
MELVEKGTVILIRKIKRNFFKYSSSIILYLSFIFLSSILFKSYNIINYKYSLITFLFIIGTFIFDFTIYMLQKYKVTFKIAVVFVSFFLGYNITYSTKEIHWMQLYDDLKTIAVMITQGIQVSFIDIEAYCIILIPIIGFLCRLLEKKAWGEITSGTSITLILYLWYTDYFDSSDFYLYAVFTLNLFYSVLNMHRKIYLKTKKAHIPFQCKRDNIINFGCIYVFIIVCLSLTFIKVMGTRSIFDIKKQYEDKVLGISKNNLNSIYSIIDSGYGNSSKLGGPVNLNRNITFRVKSDKPYYLRGIIRDVYTGSLWYRGREQYYVKKGKGIISVDKDYRDFMMQNYGAKAPGTLKVNSLSIYPENIIATSLFSPYNSFEVKMPKVKVAYDVYGSFLKLADPGFGAFYTVYFYDNGRGIESIDNMDNGNLVIDYNAASSYQKESKEEVNNMSGAYDNYLQLPDNISVEIYNLAGEITKDCNTTLDKAKAIQAYLKKNFSYSLSVNPLPEDSEFVYNFLMLEKRGYCTYFATAAAVLCRASGIPARYVEGFHMKDIKDSMGLYVVRNDFAHAWCEILISEKNNIWSVLDAVPESFENQFSENTVVTENTKIDEIVNESQRYMQLEVIAQNDENSDETNNAVIPVRDDKIIENLKMIHLIFILLLFSILFFSCMAAYKIVNDNRIKKKMLMSEEISGLYYYSQKRLRCIGISMIPGSTELEYLDSIQDTELNKILKSLILTYLEEVYGGIDSGWFNKLKFYKDLEKYLKGKQGITFYILYKYLPVVWER